MQLTLEIQRAVRTLRMVREAQQGFTMITTMLALFVLGLLSVAAIAAANGDIHLTRYDQDDKQAQSAAEAGIDDYFAHLQRDPDYWTRCAGENPLKPLGPNHAINQRFTGTPPSTRKWRPVPNANSRYSIELIPKPGKSSCDPNDPIGSMVDNDGNITIRSTGNVNGTNNYKAVVATFRRRGFLDFIYFTDLENKDPTYITLNSSLNVTSRATDANGNPTGGPDLITWATSRTTASANSKGACERHWWGTQATGEGRAEKPVWRGQFASGSDWSQVYSFETTDFRICGEITFADQDQVNGPFHSNDDIQISGTPEFGRTGNKDAVEVANLLSSDQGWRGSGTPVFRTSDGKLTNQAKTLTLPPTNKKIEAQAQAGYRYTGPTTIQLNGTKMNVTTGGTTTNNVDLPTNGVIFVKNSACIYGYKPDDTGYVDPGCGQVKVQGNYAKDLTIAAEDDIIVTGDLTRSSGTNSVLGLVANNFIRAWHPVTRSSNSCTNNNSPTNIKIDAAMLSLTHSFTVDNYDCGTSLGTLTVNGAIAQKHRGVVGTAGGTGYTKNYNYDDRLKHRSPPYFIDPTQASWYLLRENDQAGAR